MEMNAIRSIRIVATSDGVDKATAGLNNLGAAQAKLTVVSDNTSKSTLSQAKALNSLQMSLDPAYRSTVQLAAAQDKLALAQQQGLVSLERQNELLDLAAAKYRATGEASAGLVSSIGGLRGVVTGALEGIGAFAAFDAIMKIHEAIDAVVQSSSGLVHAADTIGITTTNLQELQFAGQAFELSTDTMDSALEKFSKNLGQAATGAGPLYKILQANHVILSGDLKTDFLNYANLIENTTSAEDKNLLVTTAFGKSAEELGALFDHGAAGISGAADQADRMGHVISDDQLRKIDDLNGKWTQAASVFGTIFKEAIIDVTLQFASLQDKVTGFLAWLDAQKLTGQVAGGLADAYVAQLKMLDPALLGSAASQFVVGQIQGGGGASGGKDYPSGQTIPTTVAGLNAAMASGGKDTIDPSSPPVPRTVAELNAAITKTPTVLPNASTDSAAKKFQSSIDALQKSTVALNAQTAAIGQSISSANSYTKAQELLNDATAAGLKITPQLTAQIQKQADAYGQAAQHAAEVQQLQKLQNDQAAIFRSPTENTVASTLQGIYGADWQTEMNGAIASQIRLNAELTTAKQLTSDFLTTFLGDLEQGKSLTDSLKDSFSNLALQLAKMAEDAAIQKLFQQLAGGFGGGAGGGHPILSAIASVFGFASGGIVGAGGSSRYVHPAYFDGAPRFAQGGLVDGEVPIIAHRGEEVLRRDDPRNRLNGGGGNSVAIAGTTINVSGSVDKATLSLLRKELDARDQRIQAGVKGAIGANNSAQARRQATHQ